ncbi:MAG: transketolase C-terminal domain-containing protein, partial [Dehalococcoidia bacterium]
QKLPMLAPGGSLERGAYVVEDGTDAVLIGTGSEVSLCLAARELLASQGVSARVVSMPSWELFAAQPEAYQSQVLPPGVPRLAVEAAVSLGWRQWADASVSLDRFGASAPGDVVFEGFGFTAENVAAKTRELL